jgi:hypothetical protein
MSNAINPSDPPVMMYPTSQNTSNITYTLSTQDIECMLLSSLVNEETKLLLLQEWLRLKLADAHRTTPLVILVELRNIVLRILRN